jgi:hypothetical protein
MKVEIEELKLKCKEYENKSRKIIEENKLMLYPGLNENTKDNYERFENDNINKLSMIPELGRKFNMHYLFNSESNFEQY